MQADRRISGWIRTLALAGGAQAAIQLLGFAAGLLVIRNLSADQYAFYTIANAGLGMMTVLTDSGINNGVLARAGLVWQDPTKLGAVVAAGLELRRYLAIVAALISLPIMIYLLRHQGADWIGAAIVAVSILPVFVSTISGHLLEAVPRVQQRLFALQRIQIGANLGRLVFVALTVPRWPLAAVASVVTAVPQWLANWRLRRLASRDAHWGVGGDREVRSYLLGQIQRSLPGALYYSFSGQLNIWLISLFGRSGAVAAVGALGRLSMLLTVFSSVIGVVVVPRFSRLPAAGNELVLRRFGQVLAGISLACVLPMVLLIAFPGSVLAIIGPQYGGLTREVTLMGLSSFVAIIAGSAYGLAASRGVIAPPMLAIPLFIGLQAGLIAILPVSTASGVIEVSLFSAIGQAAFHYCFFGWYMRFGAGRDLTERGL